MSTVDLGTKFSWPNDQTQVIQICWLISILTSSFNIDLLKDMLTICPANNHT